MYYERAIMNKILSNIYNVITIKGVSFVPTNVRAWALKISPSQKIIYLELAYSPNPERNRK